MPSRAMLLVCCWIACGLGTGSVWGIQDGGGEAPNFHEFRNAAGEILVRGHVQSSDGVKLQLLDVNGRPVELRMSEISEDDRKWLREETRSRKLEREALAAQAELVDFINTGKSHLVIKGIRKLRGYGAHAHNAGQLLQNQLANSRLDARTRHEALMAYIATRQLDQENSLAVLRVIQARWSECGPLIELDPIEYLTTYARFGDDAVPYLTAVAYTGELKPELGAAVPEKPVNAQLLDEVFTRNRAAAARAFGKMKNAQALELILEILAVVDRENPGKPEQEAQRNCLEALGDNGLMTDQVAEVLGKFEARFPEVVARIRERLEKPSSKS